MIQSCRFTRRVVEDPADRPVGRSSSAWSATVAHSCALTDRAGVSQPAVFSISAPKAGPWVRRPEGRCAGPRRALALDRLMSLYATFWGDRFDRLETLKRMDH
jgi:hypothetical protein